MYNSWLYDIISDMPEVRCIVENINIMKQCKSSVQVARKMITDTPTLFCRRKAQQRHPRGRDFYREFAASQVPIPEEN
jgi:hypothetical protein